MPHPPVANAHATDALDNAHGATTAELGEPEAFAEGESLAIGGAGTALPAGAPAWAVQMNLNLNKRLDKLNKQLDNIDNKIVNIDNHLTNVQAKQTNAVAKELDDPILAVTVHGVPLPPAFPTTYGQVLALNPAQSLVFLNYYNLPANPQATRNIRLRKFLGIKPV
mmetsp:Transcript_20629/g.43208  ORF Transcript_20629/g.43208 Transcript_20629/m.43208 type:complete len:166 (-) Transcript_20629:2409-2906(-)